MDVRHAHVVPVLRPRGMRQHEAVLLQHVRKEGGRMIATAIYVDLLQSVAILLLAFAVIVTALSNRRR